MCSQSLSGKNIDCPLGELSAESCPWLDRRGHIRDFPKIGVVECANCLLVTHKTDLRDFIDYKSGSMHAWASGYGGTIESPKEDVSRRIEAINSLASQNSITSILDYGSGEGDMLSALSQNFEAWGLEPEDSARENCLKKNLKVFDSIEEIQKMKSTFDLVTLFHVVEHFYSPKLELQFIFDLMNPGGFLIVETPNSQDALLTSYCSEAFSNFTYWSHHPMLHSASSLLELVVNKGFVSAEVTHVQRYGLANHLYWLVQKKPGGHEFWRNKFSESTEASYSQDLIKEGKSDTLWLIARKPFEPAGD